MDLMEPDQLIRLSSGYWLFRRNLNQWAQWPRDRECTPVDCFGWDANETSRMANEAAETKAQLARPR